MKTLAKSFIIIALLISQHGWAMAQVSYRLNESAKQSLSQLSFLEGKWKGAGWIVSQDRQRMTFESEETVQFKLRGTVLEVEGIGRSEGQIVHNALAVISVGSQEGQFDFTSFLQSGEKGTYKAELKEGKLFWYPTEQVRYIIEINDQGQWFEIGEYNDGGTWYKFFEMTLDKIH